MKNKKDSCIFDYHKVIKLITTGYLHSMLFFARDDIGFKEKSDVSPELLITINSNIKEYHTKIKNIIEEISNKYKNYLNKYGYQQLGHDFWLTRNDLDPGFWNCALGEIGNQLSNVSHNFSRMDLIIGDDGKIYLK